MMESDTDLLSTALGSHAERLFCTITLEIRHRDMTFPFSNLGKLFQC